MAEPVATGITLGLQAKTWTWRIASLWSGTSGRVLSVGRSGIILASALLSFVPLATSLAAAVLTASAASAQSPAGPPPSDTLRVIVEPGVVIVLDGDLSFEVLPLQGEGFLAFAERVCGDRTQVDLIAAANDGQRFLRAGVRYKVPWSCVSSRLQERGLQALFPEDRVLQNAWMHRVGGPRNGEVETLWRIAQWFTGSGENYAAIREHNRLPDESIERQQWLRIPRSVLLPVFAAKLPPVQVPASTSGVRSGTIAAETQAEFADALSYRGDARGPFASYRLKAGEALYSSVVVRFTGRLLAEDVNPLAHLLAARSDIDDLTDIPVGYEIKIPLEYLSPEFLPSDNPRRVEYEEERSAAAQYTNTVGSKDLRGVTVILDAGHGGKDVGAAMSGIWESVYAYDIMERVKRRLQQRTDAVVLATTRDGSNAYDIPARDVLPLSRGHRVLTSPPYKNEDSRVSANLRWALSNSMLRNRQKEGTDENNVVFVSIHADSLHPSVRGSMAYVPGLLPLRSNYRLTSDIYRSRREVREQGAVSFKHKERVRSLGLSRELADHVIEGVRASGIRIHSNQPIRDRIIRGRRPWVPAVLKYNEVPAKILVEVCNLANAEDLALIKTQAFREKFAVALVDGILAYYQSGNSARPTAGS